MYPTFLEAFGFDAPELELSERDLEAAITTAREPRPWEAEVPLPLAEASFPVLVVQGAWDVAPPGPREISATALHAICDVLVERLGAESAVFPGPCITHSYSARPSTTGCGSSCGPHVRARLGHRDLPKAAR